MKTYNATIKHPNGKDEAVTIAASSYTKAFLQLTYNCPLHTIIIELKEA